MIEQRAKSLFMFSPSSVKSAELYQEVLKGVLDYQQLGNRLIYLSERAHAFRQYDKLHELALILSNLPVGGYRLIGQYYLAVGMCRNGAGAIEMARPLLESLASHAPARYRAKAMLLLSAINQDTNSYPDAFRFYEEAITVSRLDSGTVLALKGIAVMKAREGYHKHALKDLESIYPLARYASPHVYFDYLNSYAVELAEVGRLKEARGISAMVISSPFAAYYPEWKETFTEVNHKAQKRRSTVSVGEPKPLPPQPSKANVIQFPGGERISSDETISDLPLSAIEALAMILRSVLKDRITEREIQKICDGFQLALELLFAEED